LTISHLTFFYTKKPKKVWKNIADKKIIYIFAGDLKKLLDEEG